MISSFISHFPTPPMLLVKAYQLRTTIKTIVVKLLSDEFAVQGNAFQQNQELSL